MILLCCDADGCSVRAEAPRDEALMVGAALPPGWWRAEWLEADVARRRDAVPMFEMQVEGGARATGRVLEPQHLHFERRDAIFCDRHPRPKLRPAARSPEEIG